jgi:hypothetical protein
MGLIATVFDSVVAIAGTVIVTIIVSLQLNANAIWRNGWHISMKIAT